MKITRTRQTGPGNLRKQRAHRGGSLFGTIAKLSTKALTSTGILKKGMGVGVRTLNSEIGKKMVDEGIKHAPELYRLGTSKLKTRA